MMKRSQLIRKRKEHLRSFFENASVDEKIDILKYWVDNEIAPKKFNAKLLDAVAKKHKNHGLNKGDKVYIDTIFSAYNINPYKYSEQVGVDSKKFEVQNGHN